MKFLSTPSARRATREAVQHQDGLRDFYPRPPRGGRRFASSNARPAEGISIHALREEGDSLVRYTLQAVGLFLSTPSARRATGKLEAVSVDRDNFYPRPPRGGRRATSGRACTAVLFLSTPSARRATPRMTLRCRAIIISIHALREEGDLPDPMHRMHFPVFLSTPSARRATVEIVGVQRGKIISIHALREEGDL